MGLSNRSEKLAGRVGEAVGEVGDQRDGDLVRQLIGVEIQRDFIGFVVFHNGEDRNGSVGRGQAT